MSLAAISADPREDSVALAEHLGIDFPLLSDGDLKVANAYGVAMAGGDIAVPATFVILPDRTVYWRKVGESMADRPSVEELLEVVGRAVREPKAAAPTSKSP